VADSLACSLDQRLTSSFHAVSYGREMSQMSPVTVSGPGPVAARGPMSGHLRAYSRRRRRDPWACCLPIFFCCWSLAGPVPQ
jgi:hypothetical protein